MRRKALAALVLIALLIVSLGLIYLKYLRYQHLGNLTTDDLNKTMTFKGSLKQVARLIGATTFQVFLILDDGTENAILVGEWINNQTGDISSFLDRDDLETLPLPDPSTGEYPGTWVIKSTVIDFTTGDLSTEFGVDIGLGIVTWYQASWWE